MAINVRTANEVGKVINRIGRALQKRALERGTKAFLLRAKPMIVKATDAAGAVDTANYRRRWKTSMAQRNGRPAAVISNDAPYAGVIEYGRRAGAKAPPRDVLVPWVRRKLGVPTKEAKSVAFLIARAIKRRGLKPRHVLTAEPQIELFEATYREEILRAIIDTLRSGGR